MSFRNSLKYWFVRKIWRWGSKSMHRTMDTVFKVVLDRSGNAVGWWKEACTECRAELCWGWKDGSCHWSNEEQHLENASCWCFLRIVERKKRSYK